MAPVKQRNNLVPGFTNAPPFLQFLRLSWPDITTQLLCLAAALLLYSFCPPIMPRVFPVFDGYEASTFGLGHGLPVDAEFINTWVMAVIAYSVPALVMGAFGLWAIRDFYDSNAAVSPSFLSSISSPLPSLS
jgi:diacylglycerol diphosphate phosphatase/phosphatidate phosphatase